MIPLNLTEKQYEKVANHICEWGKKFAKKNKMNTFIIGSSGGIDSAITTFFASKIFGGENIYTYFLPVKFTGHQEKKDAELVSEIFGTNFDVIPIDDFLRPYKKKYPDMNRVTFGNVQARVRMSILYMKANELQGKAVVVGTSNKTELLLGYYTKFGDGACDFGLTGDLYKTQVRNIASYIENFPERIILKIPSPGLWPKQTDEKELAYKLGITTPQSPYELYEKIDGYLWQRKYGWKPRKACSLANVSYNFGIGIENIVNSDSAKSKRELPQVPYLGGLS